MIQKEKTDGLTYLTKQTADNLKALLIDAEVKEDYIEAKKILKELFRCYLLLEKIEECKTKLRNKHSGGTDNMLHVNLSELEYFDQDFENIAETVTKRHSLKIIK